MLIYVSLFLFIFGTIIGSFLNVVVLRFNSGKTLGGRSGCFSCGKTLKYYELLPIVSYVALRGKCSVCKTQISKQYPVVEIATGSIFVGFFYYLLSSFQPETFASFLLSLVLVYAIWCVLIVLFVYDLKHKIIPDFFSVTFIVLALLNTYFFSRNEMAQHIGAAVLLFFFFFALWFISKGTWMGFGDAKLGFGIGVYLGLAQGISAVIIGFWSGAIVATGLLLYQKYKSRMGTKGLSRGVSPVTMKSEIPFAPFLIFGILVALLFHLDLFHINFFIS